MFLQNLCAIKWTNYLLDGVLALVLIGYVIYSAKRGFIDCFIGFFSTFIAFFVAITLAKAMMNLTGGLFGLHDVFEKTFTNAFMKVDGFDVHVVGEGAGEMLASKNVPAFLANRVLKMTNVAPDTVLAEALGIVTADLATLVVCGIVLFILAKLLLRLLKGVLEGIANKMKVVGVANALLGALVGVFVFTLLLSTVTSLLGLIPAVNNALSKSVIIGFFNKYNLVSWLLGLFM